MTDPALQILIAEDSMPDRLILESIVTNAGHEVIAAADGIEALQAFEDHRPDIVLLDVLMPNMGGLDAAREIRKRYEDDLVPILFLTSLTDNDSLVDCIDAGGNDFIPKPYNKTVIQTKIKAFARMREMHNTLSSQKRLIELNNQHLIQEQTVAKQVFDKIAHSGCLDKGYINYHMSPLAVFNGDVIVADISPTGSLIVLLGDFTGHGLPAAIGSMPLATTFYGMVRKGFSLGDIIREVNQKLHETLPTGFFCCATCMDINFQKRRMRIWNGGLPPNYLYKSASNSYELLESRNLPLGVLGSKQFRSDTRRIPLDFGDKIFLWSDGVYEARNEDGDMLGEDRIEAFMQEFKGRDDLIQQLLVRVHEHIGSSEKDDDISLVEIPIDDIELISANLDGRQSASEKLADWDMELALHVSTFKQFDPLPLVTNMLNDITGLTPHRTILYTIIAELYSNALEHGILGLSSELKITPQGFVAYYDERKKRLNEVESGTIKFVIHHHQNDTETLSGELRVLISDSGKGFGVDHEVVVTNEDELNQKVKRRSAQLDDSNPNYFGRGLSLMSSVCSRVTIFPPGNQVEIVFHWHEDDE